MSANRAQAACPFPPQMLPFRRYSSAPESRRTAIPASEGTRLTKYEVTALRRERAKAAYSGNHWLFPSLPVKEDVARYQQTISALLILCSLFGLVGIGRAAMAGSDHIMWAAFGAMFVLAWLARRMIMRMPIAAEAGQRARAGPTWKELSPMRRRFLLWFDWPLFIKIREREARRLMDEPIVSATFASNSMVLRPLDPSHTEPYFLKWMANAATGYGLKVRNLNEHMFGSEITGNQVELNWFGADRRIWDYLQTTLHDGAPLKLATFIDKLEEGYLSTLTAAEQHKYFMDRR